jgi:uncharacterized coiled-coil DUF342 family protein
MMQPCDDELDRNISAAEQRFQKLREFQEQVQALLVQPGDREVAAADLHHRLHKVRGELSDAFNKMQALHSKRDGLRISVANKLAEPRGLVDQAGAWDRGERDLLPVSVNYTEFKSHIMNLLIYMRNVSRILGFFADQCCSAWAGRAPARFHLRPGISQMWLPSYVVHVMRW